jgi:hypothetical protein
MKRNLKAVGLTLVAVLAMGAIVAQAAQAKFDTLRTYPAGSNAFVKVAADPSEPAQVVRFKPGGFAVTCQKFATTGATVGDKATEVTGEPFYSECKNSLSGEATVKPNGCHTRTTSETDAAGHAEAHLICGSEATEPKGAGITVETAGATITFGSQTVRGIHVTNVTTEPFVNQERHMEVTLTTTVENQLQYTCTPAFVCGLAGIGTSGTEGSINGKKTVSGREDNGGIEGNNPVGITYETLETSMMP